MKQLFGRMSITAALILMIALLAASAIADTGYKGFKRGDALITPAELKGMIDANDPDLIVIAVVKGGLTGAYTRGHIPGAFCVWRPEYEPEVGDPYFYDGMILNRAQFQEFARSFGIDADSKVVIYDHKYDATRLWWAFYLYGKTDVRVLDGGYFGWKEAGYDTDMGGSPDRPNDGTFTATSRLNGWTANMGDIYMAKTDETIQLWDTRGTEEWTGEKRKGASKRAGRIPWSNALQSWKEFRTKIDDHPTAFKTAAEIQQVIDKFGIDPTKDQIFYCQSGVRTTTNIFALYLMGWDTALLHNYDGSWLEWAYFEENPIATGE